MNIDTIGFMFKAAKVIIKCDEVSDYSCVDSSECSTTSAEWTNYNDKNLVSVFKLKKEDFINCSIGISTTSEEQWNKLLGGIEYYYNKPFIISLSKEYDKKCAYINCYDSFYSKLINSKFCPCCDSLFLFFKFNVVVNLFTSGQPINLNPCTQVQCYNGGGTNNVVTSIANLTYDLKDGDYKNVKFYFNPNDAYLEGNCNNCSICPNPCC